MASKLLRRPRPALASPDLHRPSEDNFFLPPSPKAPLQVSKAPTPVSTLPRGLLKGLQLRVFSIVLLPRPSPKLQGRPRRLPSETPQRSPQPLTSLLQRPRDRHAPHRRRPSFSPAQSSHGSPNVTPAKTPQGPPNPPVSDQARSAPSLAPRREPTPQPRCPPPRPQAPQPWLPRRADPCDVTAPSRARPQEVDPTTHWSVRPPLVKPAHRRLPGPGPRASRPPHQNAASPLAQARLPAGDWL